MKPSRLNIRSRRLERLRQEVGLWLSETFGSGEQYSKSQIDTACAHNGYGSLDDLLIAYSLFGSDLLPDIIDAENLDFSQAEIETEVSRIVAELESVFESLSGDEVI